MSIQHPQTSQLSKRWRIGLAVIALAASVTVSFVFDGNMWNFKFTRVLTMTRRITRSVDMMDSFEHDDQYFYPATTINQWLAFRIEDHDPLDMISRELDAWGNPYYCRRNVVMSDGTLVPVGVYSTGRDGVTQSDGNDTDDINSWDPQSAAWYGRQARLSITVYRVIVGLFLMPLVYCPAKWFWEFRQHARKRALPAEADMNSEE